MAFACDRRHSLLAEKESSWKYHTRKWQVIFLQHLFDNISTLLLQRLVQKQMVDIYLLWTTTPHKPVGPRNLSLRILKEPSMKSSRNIITESFDELKVRLLEAFGNVLVDIIDKTISSMNRRITFILSSNSLLLQGRKAKILITQLNVPLYYFSYTKTMKSPFSEVQLLWLIIRLSQLLTLQNSYHLY